MALDAAVAGDANRIAGAKPAAASPRPRDRPHHVLSSLIVVVVGLVNRPIVFRDGPDG